MSTILEALRKLQQDAGGTGAERAAEPAQGAGPEPVAGPEPGSDSLEGAGAAGPGEAAGSEEGATDPSFRPIRDPEALDAFVSSREHRSPPGVSVGGDWRDHQPEPFRSPASEPGIEQTRPGPPEEPLPVESAPLEPEPVLTESTDSEGGVAYDPGGDDPFAYGDEVGPQGGPSGARNRSLAIAAGALALGLAVGFLAVRTLFETGAAGPGEPQAQLASSKPAPNQPAPAAAARSAGQVPAATGPVERKGVRPAKRVEAGKPGEKDRGEPDKHAKTAARPARAAAKAAPERPVRRAPTADSAPASSGRPSAEPAGRAPVGSAAATATGAPAHKPPAGSSGVASVATAVKPGARAPAGSREARTEPEKPAAEPTQPEVALTPPAGAPHVDLVFIQWARNPAERLVSVRNLAGTILVLREGDFADTSEGMKVARIGRQWVDFSWKTNLFRVSVNDF